jgi:transposase
MSEIKRRRHAPEFKERAVKLARDLGNTAAAARELNLGYSLLQSWIAAAETAAAKGKGLSLALEEKAELQRLRKQVAEQAEELDILKKAAAYFAREGLKGNTPGSKR